MGRFLDRLLRRPPQDAVPVRHLTKIWPARGASHSAQHVLRSCLNHDLIIGTGVLNDVRQGKRGASTSAVEFLLPIAFQEDFRRRPQVGALLIDAGPGSGRHDACTVVARSTTIGGFTLVLRPTLGTTLASVGFVWIASGDLATEPLAVN